MLIFWVGKKAINFILKIMSFAVIVNFSYITFAAAIDSSSSINPSSLQQDRQFFKVENVDYSSFVSEPDSNDSIRDKFNQLLPEEQSSFLENRKVFLQKIGRSLQMIKYGFGIGSFIKEKLAFKIYQIQDELNLDRLDGFPDGVKQDIYATQARVYDERLVQHDAIMRQSMKERSDEVIKGVLRSIDQNIWSEAKAFSNMNEYGLLASVGFQTVIGSSSWGGLGGLFDIGISIGYNKDTKALVFQIFRNFEKYKSTTMKLVFLAGLTVKPGVYVANYKTGDVKQIGETYYPPFVPFSFSKTEGTYTPLFNSGLTFPPTPFNDIMSYTSELDRNIMLKISVSRMFKSFVKIESGFGMDTFSFIISPIKNAYELINNAIHGVRSCKSVFVKN